MLSREEEARYGYLAAVNSTTLADGAALDLGGGSMQLDSVADRRARERGSWPLGAVRHDRALPRRRRVRPTKQLKALRAHVRDELARAPWLAGPGARLVGIGGTVRNLAAAAMLAAELPSYGVQGFVLDARRSTTSIDELAAMTARRARAASRASSPSAAT